MNISCLVVDDEAPAVEQMEAYISRVPFLQLAGSFNNALEPISFLKKQPVDLIFLDIEMEGFTGLQFIRSLQQKPRIILTTAYDAYAIEAFDLNVTDYLLKPISFERFIQAVDKVFDQFSARSAADVAGPQYKRDYFFVKTEFRMQRVDFDDILFVEGMKEYLRIHTRHERIMTLQSFQQMEEQLPRDQFVRVHRSYMVALNKIDHVEKNRIRIGEHDIPISESYRDGFLAGLGK